MPGVLVSHTPTFTLQRKADPNVGEIGIVRVARKRERRPSEEHTSSSEDEQDAMFRRNAAQVYRLESAD